MIGPHEGKELELMLAGEKKLAVFSDYVPDEGEIDERIIPEETFSPHVKTGQIVRVSRDIPVKVRDGALVRVVCFALPEEEWRAHFYLWLKDQVYRQLMPHHSSYDALIGTLLGYDQKDIDDFLP